MRLQDIVKARYIELSGDESARMYDWLIACCKEEVFCDIHIADLETYYKEYYAHFHRSKSLSHFLFFNGVKDARLFSLVWSCDKIPGDRWLSIRDHRNQGLAVKDSKYGLIFDPGIKHLL